MIYDEKEGLFHCSGREVAENNEETEICNA
jgi:hypothetical protein